MLLAENIAEVKKHIETACKKADRNPSEATIVAVAKTFPLDTIKAAFKLGLHHFGENRVDELAKKAPQLPRAKWHFIGHLQSNKVRKAVAYAGYIHSIDSLKLLQKVDKAAAELNKTVKVFIQVNVSHEKTKSGLKPEQLENAMTIARLLPNVEILGLMTMAPEIPAEKCRPFFRQLRELASARGLEQLSMGMTNDYEVAVEEGATYLRIGRAIFGERRNK